MAKTPKNKAAEAEATEAPRADLIEKDPSEAHEALAEFIAEQTGYDPDVKTVQMVRVLYRPFIRSEEHQGRLTEAKEAREAAEAEKEQRRLEREKKAAEKASAPAAEKPAKVKGGKGKATAEPVAAEGGDEAQAAPAKTRKGKKGAGTATAEKPF